MRKQYKQKKGGGCALCKPHKRGWTKRWKAKERLEFELEDFGIL